MKYLYVLMIFLLASACNTKPEPIRYGLDSCDECRMTILDKHFGGEIITKKGKVYKFDAAECLDAFYHHTSEPVARVYFVDFNQPGQLIPAKDAFLLQGAKLHSPMGKGIAAFSTKAAAENAWREFGGKIVRCPLP